MWYRIKELNWKQITEKTWAVFLIIVAIMGFLGVGLKDFLEKDYQAIAEKKNAEALELYDEGQYDKAIELYDDAIELESKGIYEVEVIYFNRGMAYYKNKKYNQAIGDFTRAIEINPSSKYYYNRANAYEANGDGAAAMSDRIKAAAMIGE